MPRGEKSFSKSYPTLLLLLSGLPFRIYSIVFLRDLSVHRGPVPGLLSMESFNTRTSCPSPTNETLNKS